MGNPNKNFVIVDPRKFDGNPFEVAEKSCKQAEATARLLAETITGAAIMARNAQLSRNLIETPDDARAIEWEDSPQSRRLSRLHKAAKEIEAGMASVGAAASYDPKAPIPKE